MDFIGKKNRALILVPVYHGGALVWNEKISFTQIERVFAEEELAFLMPRRLRTPWVGEALARHTSWRIERVPAMWMQSLSAYNAMMLSPRFYRRFQRYEHILICQLDAAPFTNRLAEFCQMEYDYYGAPGLYPWSLHEIDGRHVRMRAGNGGFSLRRTAACIGVLERHAEVVASWEMPEDVFFAYAGKYLDKNFRVAPMKIARQFAVESEALRHVKKCGGQMPFGCHGWARYSSEFYRQVFAILGYDLGTHSAEMQDGDFKDLACFLVRWKDIRREKGKNS